MKLLRSALAAGLLGVQRLLVLLPWRWQIAVGGGIGAVAGRLLRRRRRAADETLVAAFPSLAADARARLRRAHFHELGIGLLQIGMAWWASDRRIARLVDIDGLEHLPASASPAPTLLVSGHFTTLDLVARGISLYAPLAALHRPLGNALTDRVMRWRRGRFVAPLIDKSEPRGLVRAMREGRTVWLAVDQADTTRGAVRAPFFGRDALTSTTASRMAGRFGARVIPVRCTRDDDGRIHIAIEPPLERFGDDAERDAATLNGVVERHARAAPSQYFWVHRRFKAARADA